MRIFLPFNSNQSLSFATRPEIEMVDEELLMKKYEIPEGKQLGEKLRIIEEEWVKNNFEILTVSLQCLYSSFYCTSI